MNKMKFINKAGKCSLVIEGIKGQQLNEHEIYSINRSEVLGLLPIEVLKKKNNFKLSYNVTGFIPFRNYLQTPLNKESFANILLNILNCLLSVKKAYFHQNNLLMDFDKVMVNPVTHGIYFVYVPIQYFESGGVLRNFLLDIIKYSAFAPEEDVSYVTDYIRILNTGINFSEFELEEYVKRLFGVEDKPAKKVTCPHCMAQLPEDSEFCIYCGKSVTTRRENTGAGESAVYNPLDSKNRRRAVEPAGGQVNRFAGGNAPVKRDIQHLSDETVVLVGKNNGTVLLGDDEGLRIPYLLRIKNNARIRIDKPVFRIGREYSDYCVADNNAVGRGHADIITKGSRYYIRDLYSKNKTYVDDRAIEAGKEIEIFNGTKLRLANENFVFYIDGGNGE